MLGALISFAQGESLHKKLLQRFESDLEKPKLAILLLAFISGSVYKVQFLRKACAEKVNSNGTELLSREKRDELPVQERARPQPVQQQRGLGF
jgi:hypothetical protein